MQTLSALHSGTNTLAVIYAGQIGPAGPTGAGGGTVISGAYSGSNLGLGEEVFTSVASNTFYFRTLTGSTTVNVSSGAQTISFGVNEGGVDITALSGTLTTDQFSAYADLVAESKIGVAADQVASGSHVHATYLESSDLTGSSTINITGSPLTFSVNEANVGINNLSGTLSGSKLDIHGTTAETSIADADEVLIYDADAGANRRMTKANFVAGIVGSSTKPTWKQTFEASLMTVPESSFAPLDKLNGTNADYWVRTFASGTQTYANFMFETPSDINETGTVTFIAWVGARTAAANKNVALVYGHLARANSEAWDATYTSLPSGDKAIDSTQGDLTRITWTGTVASLGWNGNEMIVSRISRTTATANELSGSMYLWAFAIEIPRA